MRDSPRRPNSVAALRSRGRRNPRTRRLARFGLLLISIAGAATAMFAADRAVRAWAAAIAVIGFVAAAIAWLAGTSRTLSDSERDPQDFQFPTGGAP